MTNYNQGTNTDTTEQDHALDNSYDQFEDEFEDEDSFDSDDTVFSGFRDSMPERPRMSAADQENKETVRKLTTPGTQNTHATPASQEHTHSTPRRKRLQAEFEEHHPVEETPRRRTQTPDSPPEESSVTPAEKWTGTKRTRKQRYRYLRDNGKTDAAEIEFFNNLGVSRRQVERGDNAFDYLRPPVGVYETEKQRQERVQRITRVVGGKNAHKRHSKMSFNRKHKEMVEFMAQFRYATSQQMSHLFAESPVTTYNRLKELRSWGLVIDKPIINSAPIWYLTQPGMLVSGYDLPKLTEERITFSMMPHQFTVNHVASHLWGATLNVLNEDEFPVSHRVNDTGRAMLGDELVSEHAIQSSLSKMRAFSSADVFLPHIHDTMKREFSQWKDAGATEFGPSPEMMLGNEYMWTLFPPKAAKIKYHVPDLVVARPRNSDMTPNSIAVEVELANKSDAAYRRTLTAYRYSEAIYDHVVWVCRSSAAARKLEQIGEDVGLTQAGRLSIVPIMTTDGVFKGKDLWNLT